MRFSPIALQQGVLLITDYGLVGRVRRCIGHELIEVAIEHLPGRTAVIDARDVRFLGVSSGE